MSKKVAPAGAKPAYLSLTQIASAFGITMMLLGIIFKPFDIHIPVFTTEQVAAICAVIAHIIVMIRRLQPQSPLYFLKQTVEEVIEIATSGDADDDDAPEVIVETPAAESVEENKGEQNV